ncbi:M16 family metallopeptidase [Amycolatopsis sp. M39]|uniref:M16 family metallopeptidase n=1 Tax=Amycolatopsis sp. M39 TaxID=1825094 RepID=UPI003510164A
MRLGQRSRRPGQRHDHQRDRGLLGTDPPDSAIDCVLRLTRAIADPAFPDDLCASERRVVLQELLSAAADPADVATERFYAQLFDGHELGRPVGGTADDFPDFTPRELLSWHRRGLTARPIAASLVGPDELMGEAIDAVAASRLAQSVSSSQDKRKAPRLQESRRVEGFRPAADTDYICLAVGGSGASRRHQLQPAYEVLAALVGGIPGSLLYERLRKELGAAYQLQTINTAFSDCGAWRVLAGTTPAEAAAVEKAIFACLDQVASGRLPEGAFEFAIAQCRGAVLIDNEDPVSRAYLTGARACDELPGESPVRRMESAFKTIDADMVAESAHRVLETYVAVSS